VFRVAISDRRIVAIDDGPDGLGRVTFTYRKSGSRRDAGQETKLNVSD
jgi:hypothetical protein